MNFIIAEIGTSHGGSEEKARRLIDAAADAGADAVKFQWVYADEILHPDTGFVRLPSGNVRLYDRFRALERGPSFYAAMLDYAHSRNLQFACSPFGLRSLRELLELRPDCVKIASPELNHFPMLRALARARASARESGGRPVRVIVSSGVSSLSDIERALAILGTDGVSLLHCVTSYPAPETEYNLRLLQTLRAVFGVETGVSDHSMDPVLVPSLAAAAGGAVTEKHITLSRASDGLDDPVALEPEQFSLMVRCVRQCEAAVSRYGAEAGGARIIRQMEDSYGGKMTAAVLGDGVKRLAASEADNYRRTNRSLHFLRAMRAGQTVGEDDIAVLRTEKLLSPGISPEYLDTVRGARLCRDVSAGAGVQFEDFLAR